MKFYFIVTLLVWISLASCTDSDKKESSEVNIPIDTAAIDTATTKDAFQYLKTDYPERVLAFKKMPDQTAEEQVTKYERFSVLFIEYVGINEKKPLYSFSDQKNNKEAYNVLRDEMFSLKMKIKKNMSLFSQSQENRLDSADAEMNKYLLQENK